MRQIGSQTRETHLEAGKRLIQYTAKNRTWTTEDIATGQRELWVSNDDFAGYVLVVYGTGYEFVRSLP